LSSSLAHIRVPPGARHALSWSTRSDKTYYVLSGELTFELEGAGSVLGAGDVCIVKKGQPFRYENRSAGPVEMILFHTPSFDLEAEVFED
jgi:mannose-6-phosphate isomerase-like protein (cupin superfamily)